MNVRGSRMEVENLNNKCIVKLVELKKGDCFIYNEKLYLMLGSNMLTRVYTVVNLNEDYIRTFEDSKIKVQKVSAKVVIDN